ncbi:malectin domain-containing carbohydrate-binding protein [Hymenobacter sp. ASUV-10]|uniref:Malectin domain-containing carbohydrate-binding protein n=1 Tax=Hymenobacter aranciens TaxID=3063996 RepID=A0ABT9BHL4_9BACT|nr:malectin domain-containing carbohydrate-binding protein [Hymenobacter sp. ASUV-10]MDO7877726.1 malectin domain-containing carbohydrate-binding protein [Hymenobacter sp. ASUV-10]
MAFNVSTIRPLYPVIKLLLAPQTNITAGGLGLFSKQPSRTAKTVYSDGTVQWHRQNVANVGIAGKAFAVAEPGRYLEMYMPGLPSDIIGFDSRGTNLLSINSEEVGTLDFRPYPNINSCVLYSMPFRKVLGSFNGFAPFLRFNSVSAPLDLSECHALGGINMPAITITDLVFPPAATNQGISSIVLGEIRMVNKDFVIPAYPALISLDLTTSPYFSRLNTLDLQAVPTLVTVNVNGTGPKDILYTAANYAALTTLNLQNNRLSTRTEQGGNFYGNDTDTGLVALVRNSLKLHILNLSFSGHGGAEFAALVDALYVTRTSRPATTSRTLNLAGMSFPSFYPSFAATDQPNDSIVDLATRQKLAALLRRNWFINYNPPRGTLSYDATVGATVVQVTFPTELAIDCWAVNDIVTLSSPNAAGALTAGNYRVATTSPGGKSWHLEAVPGTPALVVPTNQGGTATVDKPLSYRFRCGSTTYTDTSLSSWKAISQGVTYISPNAVTDTRESGLYQTMCMGAISLTLAGLLNGNYIARMHFYDDESMSSSPRVFSVSFDGTTVLTDLNIRATVGYRTALQQEAVITVTNNQTVLSLLAGTGTPILSAVELIRVL